MLNSLADDKGQSHDEMTVHVMARIADSLYVNAVEISYAKVWTIINISTEGRTHIKDPADKEIMLNLLRDHVRNTAYSDYWPPTVDCRHNI